MVRAMPLPPWAAGVETDLDARTEQGLDPRRAVDNGAPSNESGGLQ